MFRTLLLTSLFSLSLIPTPASAAVECYYYSQWHNGVEYQLQRCKEGGRVNPLTEAQKEILRESMRAHGYEI